MQNDDRDPGQVGESSARLLRNVCGTLGRRATFGLENGRNDDDNLQRSQFGSRWADRDQRLTMATPAALRPGQRRRLALGCWLAAAATLSATAACTGPTNLDLDTSADRSQFTIGIGFGSPELVYSGEIVGNRLCIWVDLGDGSSVSLRWPNGAVAHRDPLRVESASGRVLAKVGDHLTGQEGGTEVDERGCHPGAASTFLIAEPVG